MIIGRPLARRIKAKLGDCVQVVIPFGRPGQLQPVALSFKVLGIFEMGFHQHDTHLAYVALEDLRQLEMLAGKLQVWVFPLVDYQLKIRVCDIATITYTDVNAQPQRADAVSLPWSYDTTTTQPAVFVNVAAQGDSDSLGCRIKIDDVVKDERSVNTLNAFTYCLDKSG